MMRWFVIILLSVLQLLLKLLYLIISNIQLSIELLNFFRESSFSDLAAPIYWGFLDLALNISWSDSLIRKAICPSTYVSSTTRLTSDYTFIVNYSSPTNSSLSKAFNS